MKKKYNEDFVNIYIYIFNFKLLFMSTLLYLRHLCLKMQTNFEEWGVAGAWKNAGKKPAANQVQGSIRFDQWQPTRSYSLGYYYARWREKEDKYFLQMREKIMLSKNFLFCEVINILSKWRELPRQLQGNKIVVHF